MSDAFRKSFQTRTEEKMTPNSTKSTQQKLKEGITDTVDRVARGAQPDSQKSTSQAMFDKGQRTSDREVHGGSAQAMGDKFKGALGIHKH